MSIPLTLQHCLSNLTIDCQQLIDSVVLPQWMIELVSKWTTGHVLLLSAKWNFWQAGYHLCPWLVSGQITQTECCPSSPTLYISHSLYVALTLSASSNPSVCFIKEMRESSVFQKKRWKLLRSCVYMHMWQTNTSAVDKIEHNRLATVKRISLQVPLHLHLSFPELTIYSSDSKAAVG